MHLFKTIIIVFAAVVCAAALLSSPPVAVAAASPQVLDAAALRAVFFEVVSQDAPWPSQALEVTGFVAAPAYLSLPAGALEFRSLTEPYSQHLGKKKLEVSFLVNGHEEARVVMKGELNLYGDVVVTTRRVGRNSVLSHADLTVVRRNISYLGPDPVGLQAAIGQRSKSSLRPGTMLLANMLEAPPLVKRGDLVTIKANSANIVVSVLGEVRSSGARGEAVKVKNLMSRREVYGEVVDAETVRVIF